MPTAQLAEFAVRLTGASAGATPAEGGAHEIDWLFVASLFTNFFLFFGFLFWKVAPLVTRSLENRRASMAVDLDTAQTKQAEAEARLAEYQTKLDNLESEVARVVEAYEKQAQADRERIEEETEKALARLGRETEFNIQQEMLKAEQLIRSVAVDATLELAESKIRSRMTAQDQERLTNQYVSVLNGSSS